MTTELLLPDWRSEVARLRNLMSNDKAEVVLARVVEAYEAMEEKIGDLLMEQEQTGRGKIRSKGESRFPKRRHKPYRDFIKGLSCAVFIHGTKTATSSACGTQPCRYKIEACHLIPKARGSDDRGNLWPGCAVHHDEQEGNTADFEARHSLDLAALVLEYDAQFVKEEGF